MGDWTRDRVAVAYDEKLLAWQLAPGHPTNPVRAANSLRVLDQLGCDYNVQPITYAATNSDLALIHDPAYVARTDLGLNDEWKDVRLDLAYCARHMFSGTVQLTRALQAGDVRVGFTPQGAKHHAMWDYGSGFCVYNDFAWAACALADAGERVAYIDLDAHHGDGVEALTRNDPRILTASIHDETIFPGTGHESDPNVNVFNFPLAAASGNVELLEALDIALCRAADFKPTVVLCAIGGDGHVNDPLSSLRYTNAGYAIAGLMVGRFAQRFAGGRLLLGGAGGYRPHDDTPESWGTFVASAAEEVFQNDVHGGASLIR